MAANLENSVVATGLEEVSFHSSLKEGQWQSPLDFKEIKPVNPKLN